MKNKSLTKAKVYDLNGNKVKEIDLPDFFSYKLREDILSKVLEAQKSKQPYGPNPVSGMQYSASGKLIHKRGVWKSQYKKGISRIPRKIMSRRGSQFNWEGATSPNTRGGRKAHPPKALSMINTKKINKKEILIAFKTALSSTANKEKIKEKYSTLKDKKIENVPFIINKIDSNKTKDILNALKKILGEDLSKIAIKKRSIRPGKGKLRGRKYKSNAGLLLVVGENENFNTKNIDIRKTKELSVLDLAKGGAGRLTVYTESAIKELENKLKEKSK
ncbi:MAG: 50S ribosomal protein L4 [Nanoarchaeota archaeon]